VDADIAGQAFREEQDRRSHDRQLLLLGAMFASKEMRAKVTPEHFADYALRCAADDMLGAGTNGKSGLQAFANSVGLHEWDAKTKGPAAFFALLLNHCRADAELRDVLFNVVRSFQQLERVASGTLADKHGAAAKARQIAWEVHNAANPEPPSKESDS
jgi:hypothetical protein